MHTHPLRALIRKLGIDIHAYRPAPTAWEWLQQFHIETILDIGANTGQFLDEIRPLFPTALMYAFEPVQENLAQLHKRAAKDSRYIVLPYALGVAQGTQEITVNEYSPSSSLLSVSSTLTDAFPFAKESVKQTIEVRRLDDVLADKPLPGEMLINMDVQGYEDKVLSGGQAIFSKARIAIVESSFVELYADQPLFKDIYDQMHTLGFVYRGALRQKFHPRSGELLFEDSLFLKEETN